MDIRDILVDGIEQATEWYDEALAPLTAEQLNFLPGGKATSIGFNAWHWYRTADNITHFVFQKQKPIWMEQGYVEKLGLPPVAQGTGMSQEEAQALTIKDPAILREYGALVTAATLQFVKNVEPAILAEMQMVKPLGEMPKWRVIRQVVMTHGFMHLGEINAIRGILGLQFSI